MFRIATAIAAAAALALAALPAQAAPTRLVAKVGPGFTITLTKGGKKVTSLKAGAYVITVRDLSNIHNFHLRGPGVNKDSGVEAVATKTWRVTLRKGTYRYICDPHDDSMKGSVRVS